MAQPKTGVETALQALRARDHSAAELESRLERRGIAEHEQRETLKLLSRLGYVDDGRFAALRAAALATRNGGDELIRDDLERRGIASDAIEAAVRDLEPEVDRARRLVAGRGRSLKTARYLVSRGFAEGSIEAAVAWEDDEGVE